jgi:putative tryptophan/tyrosine transport system substrate-binding protein
VSEDIGAKTMSDKFFVWLLATILLTTIPPASAQQPAKMFRIGFLDPSNASGMAVLVDAFRQELNKLGWIEGKNITFEYRFAEQKFERPAELATDLVRLKVDLILVSGAQPASAAKNATTTIPIVMSNAADPVGGGLINSLARPGGNVTGLAGLGSELITKRLEILKDAVPKLVRVGVLRLPGANIAGDLQLKELRHAAVALKLKLEEIETQLDLCNHVEAIVADENEIRLDDGRRSKDKVCGCNKKFSELVSSTMVGEKPVKISQDCLMRCS